MSLPVRIGLALTIVLGLIAAADEFLKERPHRELLKQQLVAMGEETSSVPTMEPALPSSSSSIGLLASSASSISSSVGTVSSAPTMSSSIASSTSAPRVVKKGVSLKKKSSVDVATTLASLQFTSTATSERGLLQGSAGSVEIHTSVLLLQNDRAAYFAWIENDDAKTILQKLKQTVQDQFSPQLKDLIDETLIPADGPPVDVLSFLDPAISAEKVIIIRVRNRLYEFHVAVGSEGVVSQLIAALSR
jgi:hypothetical protein